MKDLYKYGHFGLSLLLLMPVALFLGALGFDKVAILVTYTLVAAFSSLPDLDIKWRPIIKHRGPTHTLFAGIGFGMVLGAILGWSHDWSMFSSGFITGFMATLSHLIGDVLTHTPIMPFYPFSRKGIALHLFKSSNKAANYVMLFLGIIALALVSELLP
jgi:membrane-bound metal-dependent hydrolase YbcI (DUF457 family)